VNAHKFCLLLGAVPTRSRFSFDSLRPLPTDPRLCSIGRTPANAPLEMTERWFSNRIWPSHPRQARRHWDGQSYKLDSESRRLLQDRSAERSPRAIIRFRRKCRKFTEIIAGRLLALPAVPSRDKRLKRRLGRSARRQTIRHRAVCILSWFRRINIDSPLTQGYPMLNGSCLPRVRASRRVPSPHNGRSFYAPSARPHRSHRRVYKR